jgi:addiction module RelE/StbE family toxin
MEIRWSPAAAQDLLSIGEYIAQENPSASQRIVRAIYDAAGSLTSYPHRGRLGRVEGTRELPLPPLPFVVVYRVAHNAVEIANVVHGAQKWPP